MENPFHRLKSYFENKKLAKFHRKKLELDMSFNENAHNYESVK
jgi:hypothetical protein